MSKDGVQRRPLDKSVSLKRNLEVIKMHSKELLASGQKTQAADNRTAPACDSENTADVSLNFSVAKVVAIFTVVAGHWFTGTILWIPVTFGLFVFAFSSAYFTSTRYGARVDQRQFWRKKLERLWIRFWVILAFLSMLLMAIGKPVAHWHSALHFLGLSGFLNWFGIPNQSGLGAGLWFFTLLLLFYCTYPFLARLGEQKTAAGFVAALGAVLATFLDAKVKVGHELWFTAFGFVLGVMHGLHEPNVSRKGAFFLSVLSCCLLLVLNLFTSLKMFNSVLILAASISISLWLTETRLPAWGIVRLIARLDAYLLEIFLIHGYLFFRTTGNAMLDFAASLLLIVVVAVLLSRIIAWLTTFLFSKWARD